MEILWWQLLDGKVARLEPNSSFFFFSFFRFVSVLLFIMRLSLILFSFFRPLLSSFFLFYFFFKWNVEILKKENDKKGQNIILVAQFAWNRRLVTSGKGAGCEYHPGTELQLGREARNLSRHVNGGVEFVPSMGFDMPTSEGMMSVHVAMRFHLWPPADGKFLAYLRSLSTILFGSGTIGWIHDPTSESQRSWELCEPCCSEDFFSAI